MCTTPSSFSIRIYDKNHCKIGESMNCSVDDIRKYIEKGFVVVDIVSGKTFNPDEVYSMIGVSDCIMV